MLAYNYQINFSLLKKWLPQTTQKIIYYLENLNKSQDKDNTKFDINKTRWELCAKAKNNKGALHLEKAILCEGQEPTLEDFKKLLELSHMVEIYVKGFFNKITYRSPSISYHSYKNQHDYAAKKELKKDPEFAMTAKGVKIDIKGQTIVYINGSQENELYEAKFFCFEGQEQCLFAMAYHSEEEQKIKSYSLYEINASTKQLRVKYYIDNKTADAINAIKDLNYHEINGKRLKIVLTNTQKFTMVQ